MRERGYQNEGEVGQQIWFASLSRKKKRKKKKKRESVSSILEKGTYLQQSLDSNVACSLLATVVVAAGTHLCTAFGDVDANGSYIISWRQGKRATSTATYMLRAGWLD